MVLGIFFEIIGIRNELADFWIREGVLKDNFLVNWDENQFSPHLPLEILNIQASSDSFVRWISIKNDSKIPSTLFSN